MFIIDQSVNNKELIKVFNLLKIEKVNEKDILYLKEKYPGMPDIEILKHFVKKDNTLITSDRVLHNKALEKGEKSIYLSHEGKITFGKLKGIVIKEKNNVEKETDLKESYEIEKSEFHEKLLPETEIQLKKLKTKRRRIRNHFEGLENISNVDLTLSSKTGKNGTIIGIKVRAVSNNGMKALDASEIYILEKTPIKDEKVYFLYCLINIDRLMLNQKPIAIYYDEKGIIKNFEFERKSEYSENYEEIIKGFKQIEYKPVGKGVNIESLRRKVNQLSIEDKGNELIEESIENIMKKMATADNSQVYAIHSPYGSAMQVSTFASPCGRR